MATSGRPSRDPGKRNSGRATPRFSRGIALWFVVFVAILVTWSLMGRSQAGRALSLGEYWDQVTNGTVATADYDGGASVVSGTLTDTIPINGSNVYEYHARFPEAMWERAFDSLRAQGAQVSYTPPGPGLGVWVGMIPWVVIIVVWLWFMRAMQSGGNKAFQFGRSKAKLITPDTPSLDFGDVAGAEEAKEELSEIVDFLKDPDLFSRLGGRLPKGVLLIGPPGTGKTLLARAVAGEAGRPFFQMSGSDFVEMFVGVGASRVRDLFEQGKTHAPCIVFVDEIDAVGRHRGAGLGGGHDEREQTLNALLVEMDGFEPNSGVILLAATNRPDVLDPALLRPGRFDRRVVVDLPDVRGREGILRVHAKKLPMAKDVDLAVIARGTPGLSGADLSNICNEAALGAARRSAESVTMRDFERARDKVMLGTERKSMVLTASERRLTAYHEAGHAVVAVRVPGLDPVHKVTIVPHGRALGLTAAFPEEDRHSHTLEWMKNQLVMLFGGRVAEELVFGAGKVTTGAGNDIERATSIARRMVTRFGMSERVGLMAVGDSDQEVFIGRELVQRRDISEHTARLVDEEVKLILDRAHKKAREVVEEHRDLLEAIAQALLDLETLNQEQLGILAKGGALPPTDSGTEPSPAEALESGEPAKEKDKSLPMGTPAPLPSPA